LTAEARRFLSPRPQAGLEGSTAVQDFPHHYSVVASGEATGDVVLQGRELPTLHSAPPPEFGGPGDRWSPETFLAAAVADCFVLTFRAVARASRVSWITLRCEVVGTLDRVDGVTQFTNFDLRAHLQAAAGTTLDQARRALEKAEHHCLISNSLKATIHLETEIDVAAEPALTATAAVSR
jgi:organic hydroperoxide reductase OsmC/OhrA